MFAKVRLRFSWRLIAAVAVLLGLAAVVDTPVLAFYRISGNSMRPGFRDGDRVLVTTLCGVDVGDTIIARVHGETLIKRVVAGPGDVIALWRGEVLRNGRESDPVPREFRDGSCEQPRRLAAGEYFLLGDNRAVSVDSRVFGPVERDDIVGRVVYHWFATSDKETVAAARGE